MKLLKENYEGLYEIDELSQALKTILLKPDIQEALQNNDFNTLYKELPLDYASYFTHLMSSLNIDPLKYLDYIPDFFLAYTTIRAINIPSHIKRIGKSAFEHCINLMSINYIGTKDQWSKINLEIGWNRGSSIKTIHCIDGDIEL